MNEPRAHLLEELLLALVGGGRGGLLFNPRVLILIQSEWFPLDRVIDLLDELGLQILLRVDTFDHLGEVVDCHSTFGRVRVMQRCLHHHCGVGEQEDALSGHLTLDSIAAPWVIANKLFTKYFHDSVHDLSLSWEAEAE